MAEWTTVAQGAHFWDIKQTVADMDLPRGTRVRIVMDAPGMDRLFDAAGAELVFKPVIPKGTRLIDVWGENGKGIVELEAEGVWIAAVVAGLPVWAWLILGGITLLALVSLIVVMVRIPKPAIPYTLIIIVAAALAAIVLIGYFVTKAGVRTPTIAIGGGT